MSVSTYSFSDLTGTISEPSVGSYGFTGKGIGEMTIAYAAERSAHDVAADGAVMVSKINNNTGTCTIQCQQTSALQAWLISWFNYLVSASTSSWADTTITIRSSTMNRSHVLTGVSPQKIGDQPYQAQGQRCSWVLMAADIATQNA
ncbi:MAG: phage protein [Parabacteroides sp.]